MRLPLHRAEAILGMLCEGVSVRSIERLTDVHRDTILRLLVKAGERCEKVLGTKLRNVPVQDVQCDEIWGYVQKKESHKWPHEAHDDSVGDAYCFVAIERQTKLILNFALGRRSQATTNAFIEGLRLATAPQRFQLTTDGFAPYITAIDSTLSDRVDYGMLIKTYAAATEGETRYSPPEVVDTTKKPILGDPDAAKICTSHIERQNLTMRMQIRRLTRLTNAFSKKWDNLWAALCLHFAWYNFVRVHRSLRVTPAMEAGIADHVWEIGELISSDSSQPGR
ncbi:MAG TPA: IS1 family transposase [Bryobacteraceae bacterium]|nr:IS1 family transposase [Bryobacteraceae bacterium]